MVFHRLRMMILCLCFLKCSWSMRLSVIKCFSKDSIPLEENWSQHLNNSIDREVPNVNLMQKRRPSEGINMSMSVTHKAEPTYLCTIFRKCRFLRSTKMTKNILFLRKCHLFSHLTIFWFEQNEMLRHIFSFWQSLG